MSNLLIKEYVSKLSKLQEKNEKLRETITKLQEKINSSFNTFGEIYNKILSTEIKKNFSNYSQTTTNKQLNNDLNLKKDKIDFERFNTENNEVPPTHQPNTNFIINKIDYFNNLKSVYNKEITSIFTHGQNFLDNEKNYYIIQQVYEDRIWVNNQKIKDVKESIEDLYENLTKKNEEYLKYHKKYNNQLNLTQHITIKHIIEPRKYFLDLNNESIGLITVTEKLKKTITEKNEEKSKLLKKLEMLKCTYLSKKQGKFFLIKLKIIRNRIRQRNSSKKRK